MYIFYFKIVTINAVSLLSALLLIQLLGIQNAHQLATLAAI
jgi:hypothetical protein